MPSFAELLSQGAGNAWLFVPSAILLGALHGLEPGHSKTMMAAFIVAIRGTVAQAVMLGLAATLSHTLVVWGIALGGMYLWRGVAPEAFEPWFQLLSGVIIIAMALWMILRTRQDQRLARAAADHSHGHGHSHGGHHGHAHGDETRRIDTGQGVIVVEVFEDGVPPRWRVRTERGHAWKAADISIATMRPGNVVQAFAFVDRGGYLESVDEIPEPHEFEARVSLGHGNHTHDCDLSFVEGHGHAHAEMAGLNLGSENYQDAHERAHANDIRKRFTDRNVTNWQIIVFGLTGGLIPCPAAITVLLLCLQLKEITLGAALVFCFSIGLAITLVTVGAAAAISVRYASSRFSWLSTLARRAPYFSGVLIIAVGLYVAVHGWLALPRTVGL
jgi:nickel/cobalt exporter